MVRPTRWQARRLSISAASTRSMPTPPRYHQFRQSRRRRSTHLPHKGWRRTLETCLRGKIEGNFFHAIAFWDSDHGIVVSDPVAGHFVVFTTADAGITWHHVWPDPESTPSALLNEGAFAASNSCIALNGSSNVWLATGGASISRVFRSNDRGNTWKVSEVPFHPTDAVSGLFSVAFRDARNGIAVGGVWAHPTSSPPENVFVTSDGGVTWPGSGPQTIPPGQFLSSVIYKPAAGSAKSDRGSAPAAASAEVVAAGPGGIISMHPGGRWIHESDEKYKRRRASNAQRWLGCWSEGNGSSLQVALIPRHDRVAASYARVPVLPKGYCATSVKLTI